MMFKLANILLLATLPFVWGCQEQIVKAISENDAATEVLNSNGGSLEYSILGSVGEDQKDFELRLINSPLAESLQRSPDILTSGVATQFYSHLQKPLSCRSITVKVVFASGDSVFRRVDSPELITGMRYKARFDNVFNLMKSNNYEALKDSIDPTHAAQPYDKEKLVSEIMRANAQLGELKSSVYSGFREYAADGHKNIVLTGSIVGTAGFIPANIYIAPASNKIVQISYGR